MLCATKRCQPDRHSSVRQSQTELTRTGQEKEILPPKTPATAPANSPRGALLRRDFRATLCDRVEPSPFSRFSSSSESACVSSLQPQRSHTMTKSMQYSDGPGHAQAFMPWQISQCCQQFRDISSAKNRGSR